MADPWFLAPLLDEERRLRALAEAQVRSYRKLLVSLAMQLAPHVVDARRREDPRFPQHLSPEGWRALFSELAATQKQQVAGWPDQNLDDRAHLKHQVKSLEAENRRLQRALAEQKSDSGSPKAETGDNEATGQASQPEIVEHSRSHPVEPADRTAPTDSQRPDSQPALLDPLASFTLPPAPPARFASLFYNWEREGLVLGLLALTGWSLRYAIDEALARRVGIGVGSGSTKRLFRRLVNNELVTSHVYDLGGLRAAILVLTDTGETVVRSIGVEPVPSEWSILLRSHGGAHQARHAALCCTFAYQARRRAWTTHICPEVEGPAEPDVLMVKDHQSIYVEVEAESGETERRMRKWRNQEALQGFVALCANTVSVRQRLVTEARAAAKHGVATDVPTLIKGDDLWVEQWGRGLEAPAPATP